eukprot:Gregarina_sp_Poly_1__210@NODE_1049_length_5236_cov_775_534146_g729_i0_p4_GENE_NODE_1049_length_5236_cov_775_534146_g729_i0NODE_1049_length_5236_cov_775_534146_g729_i0_p4_ORF_typecomplete_len188_score23_35Rad51/PF08423_11/3_5e14RecA/PF00154_21/3_4e02RecA/PF00154_21/0_00077RecA/PF00154_21/1_5e02HHH_5/PF14520_6/1_2e04HHH_5/PF14520_6/8_6e05HHH_5/PF14520_6/5_6e03ATPase/PF06745_13/1_1ATPase/PF06745_13/38HHH_6/PF14579_6/7_2e02HHH_6/PF14579_6/0_6DUF2090/PF09863_9/0_2_NODE_1049_length_5236_cov_775_534146
MSTIIESKSTTSKTTVAGLSTASKATVKKSEAVAGGVTQHEDELVFSEVDRLQECGVNAADILKLKQAGLNTTLSVIQTCRRDLLALKGFTDAKVEKILEAAGKFESVSGFMSGSQLLQRRATVLHITTGSLQLDKILNGGIESMAITELFGKRNIYHILVSTWAGENRTGKTQLCHTICVTGTTIL